ncbi:MAG: hypothetical protein GIKADHBN_01972 [Phycisphaerales bacterium]|nr:hypothetical protein [Phycisphaerales bacterium]
MTPAAPWRGPARCFTRDVNAARTVIPPTTTALPDRAAPCRGAAVFLLVASDRE